MLLRREAEHGRLADLLACTTLARSSAPGGTPGSSMLGSTSSSRRIAASSAVRRAPRARHLLAQRGGLGLERRRVGAGAAALPDLLGQRVASRLPLLQRGQRGAALGVERQDRVGARRQAAAGQVGVERGRVLPDGADVVHQTSTGLGSTQLGGLDRDLVQHDQRQREAGLGDDVGRGQDRGDDEHADIGVAPILLQPARRDDADLGQQRQQHRQLEGDAEGEDQLHHQVEVFADLRLELHRQAAGAVGGLEAEEEASRRPGTRSSRRAPRRARTARGRRPGTAAWRASRCGTGRARRTCRSGWR